MFSEVSPASIDSLSLDCSHTERHLRTEVLTDEAVYSGLRLSVPPRWEGRLSFTCEFSLYIHSLPLSDSGHLSPRDREGSMGGGPNSSHSWDTRCVISENQGVSLCAAPLFVSSSLLRLLLMLYCSYTVLTQRLLNTAKKLRLFVLMCGFIYYQK